MRRNFTNFLMDNDIKNSSGSNSKGGVFAEMLKQLVAIFLRIHYPQDVLIIGFICFQQQ